MRSLFEWTETPQSDSATRSGVERGHAAGVRRLGTRPPNSQTTLFNLFLAHGRHSAPHLLNTNNPEAHASTKGAQTSAGNAGKSHDDRNPGTNHPDQDRPRTHRAQPLDP